MSDASATIRSHAGWTEFWFAPGSVSTMGRLRGVLCLITALYFVSSWSDATFWFGDGGPLSTIRVSTFLKNGGLEEEARWIVSPLFLNRSPLVYRLYLIVGVASCAIVAAGRGGRVACWVLWLLMVGWANRAMFVSGLGETLLSLALFAAAIAPPAACWKKKQDGDEIDAAEHWLAGLSQRLMAVQVTVIGLATFVTMLGGRVWFNGSGAYALAAPVDDRSIDWTAQTWFTIPAVNETLTHALVFALPLGFLLAWLPRTNRVGQAILIGWCFAVALLGSHWLHGATLAAMIIAICPVRHRASS